MLNVNVVNLNNDFIHVLFEFMASYRVISMTNVAITHTTSFDVIGGGPRCGD